MDKHITLTKDEIEGPCVYVFWLNGVCQYIGSSESGLVRPMSKQHHIYEVAGFDYDKLEVFKQLDHETALVLESIWIIEKTPRYNVVGKPSPHYDYRHLIDKSRDRKTGEYLVVSSTGFEIFRHAEKFERDRFYMQEHRRNAIKSARGLLP